MLRVLAPVAARLALAWLVPTSVTLTVLVLVAGAIAGCGGSQRAATASAAPATGRESPSGAAIFAGSCAACHTLIGRRVQGKQGGDLLGYHLSRAQLESFTRIMPARHTLTADQIRIVSGYLLMVQRRAAAAR